MEGRAGANRLLLTHGGCGCRCRFVCAVSPREDRGEFARFAGPHVTGMAKAAAAAAAAKALEKHAIRAFREEEVPGLADATTTEDKMKVVVKEAQRVQQVLEREDTRLQGVWRKVDVDKSGSLDKHEVRQVLEEMGWDDITDEMADEMMGVIDADGSGEVDFEEFKEWFMQQDQGLRGDVARRTRKLEAAMSDPMLRLPEGWLEKVLG